MKQVIVVNQSLEMPVGKMAVQVAHASVSAYLKASDDMQKSWLEKGMPKIVVICTSEDDLKELLAHAENAQIAASLIQDAGKTVLPAGSLTCLGLGPARSKVIDVISGNLKLM